MAQGFSVFLPAANASLGRDGQQRIAQLGHYRAQKVQLVVVQRICEGVGYGGDEGCQFAWIHKQITPVPLYVPPRRPCPPGREGGAKHEET